MIDLREEIVINQFFVELDSVSISSLKIPTMPFSRNFMNSNSMGIFVLNSSIRNLCLDMHQCLMYFEPEK